MRHSTRRRGRVKTPFAGAATLSTACPASKHREAINPGQKIAAEKEQAEFRRAVGKMATRAACRRLRTGREFPSAVVHLLRFPSEARRGPGSRKTCPTKIRSR